MRSSISLIGKWGPTTADGSLCLGVGIRSFIVRLPLSVNALVNVED